MSVGLLIKLLRQPDMTVSRLLSRFPRGGKISPEKLLELLERRIIPTQNLGATPRGFRTEISPGANPQNQIELRLENTSADILANRGYLVEQNPIVLGLKNPDFSIEGQIFDQYSPRTSNPDSIRKNISRDKVKPGQARRIILNLDNPAMQGTVDLDRLRSVFSRRPVDDLEEIIVIQNNQVIPFFP
jgi:Contact-dependent growth inhibition CdiA C-terminal domain